MTIEEVVKKAIEGGWKFKGTPILDVKPTTNTAVTLIWAGDQYSKDGLEETRVEPELIFLDPKFWEALGKALRWSGEWVQIPPYKAKTFSAGGGQIRGNKVYPEWQFIWHQFIDHLAEGKTASDYFKTL